MRWVLWGTDRGVWWGTDRGVWRGTDLGAGRYFQVLTVVYGLVLTEAINTSDEEEGAHLLEASPLLGDQR